MAKVEGPEEFFEVFRTARQRKKRPSGGAGAPSAAPEAEASGQGATPAAQEPQPEGPDSGSEHRPSRIVVSPPSTERPTPRTVASPKPAAEHRFPFSVFAEDEPMITIRRSTVVFVLVALLVLLFIFYALGKRAGRAGAEKAAKLPDKTAVQQHGAVIETRTPLQPEGFRGKCAVYLKTLDHTQPASEANARACRDFLGTSSDAEFIAQGGKEPVVFSYDQRLFVCVGPFDTLDGPDVKAVVQKLRELRYNGVRQFAGASVQPLPPEAKLFP